MGAKSIVRSFRAALTHTEIPDRIRIYSIVYLSTVFLRKIQFEPI